MNPSTSTGTSWTRNSRKLGYDSLAILETASHVERGFGVQLPEDEVGQQQTPREFVEFVNSMLSRASMIID